MSVQYFVIDKWARKEENFILDFAASLFITITITIAMSIVSHPHKGSCQPLLSMDIERCSGVNKDLHAVPLPVLGSVSCLDRPAEVFTQALRMDQFRLIPDRSTSSVSSCCSGHSSYIQSLCRALVIDGRRIKLPQFTHQQVLGQEACKSS